MTATAAHTAALYAKSTSGSVSGSDEIDGINSVSVSQELTELETTDFKDTSSFKTRIAGLKDGSIEISGDFEPADAPQNLVRSSFLSGATIYITYLRDGTNGARFPALVTSIKEDGAVDGKAQFSATLKLNGAPTALP